MSNVSRVAKPPAGPLLVWDGDCHFCRFWVQKLQQRTGGALVFTEFQDPTVAEGFPDIPRSQFETAVQLILTDGRVLIGAKAIFAALAEFGNLRWPRAVYEHVPWAGGICEAVYRFVASHRTVFSRLTRIGWGNDPQPASNRQVSYLFLRALAIIYFVAFASLGTQILGLAGESGIVPAKDFIRRAAQYFDANHVGVGRYFSMPTVGWFAASDDALRAMTISGAALSIGLLFGFLPRLSLIALWLLYLSLANLCGVFLQFQWDALLLEAGLLAIFLAPNKLFSRLKQSVEPSHLAVWLLRWLLFRLMFESGCVKLLSGDPLWHQLTALQVHFETQPLPTWLGWYAHQSPRWVLKVACVLMFFIELVLPFLVFGPPRLRRWSFWPFVSLQIGILLTGNYGFFNWLTIALCLMLLDDRALPRPFRSSVPKEVRSSGAAWKRVPLSVLALLIFLITGMQLLGMFGAQWVRARPITTLFAAVAPFRSINSYGLFAVMTPSRPEIIVEGSVDGQTWKAYAFKYKPQELDEPPAFVAPHQPRLDWQMWFAALGSYRDNPWFMNLCVRLLQGEPKVLALLETNPFAETPPKLIRARTYDYRFTRSVAAKDWWTRQPKGDYLLPIALQQPPGE